MKKWLFYATLLLFFKTPVMAQVRLAEGPVYIIHSDAGALQIESDDKAVLIMSDIDQTVSYVYSHPKRRIGAELLPEFMLIWASGNKLQYDKDPPDAHLLYYYSPKIGFVDLFIELLDVNYNQKENTIHFELHFLSKPEHIKENLGEVTLFVDCFPFCV